MVVKRKPPGPSKSAATGARLGAKFQRDRAVLIKALNDINKTIFAGGAKLGSHEYFKIRALCVDNIHKVGGRVL